MDKSYYEKVFSNQRMAKYFEMHSDNEETAILHYKINIELSEAFYTILSIYEVALRNSLNRELITYFGTTEWYLNIANQIGLNNLKGMINTAQKHIAKRNEIVTGDKMVAELTLGFWVRLLNAEYERILWKPIRRAFPYLEKSKKQRNKVSSPLNKIRDFRNRVFHHEPISWNLNSLEETNARILMVMGWLNRDLPELALEINRVPHVLIDARSKLGIEY